MAREACEAAERAGNHVFHARALALEGAAAGRQGRHAAADRVFRRAFDILRARGAVAEMAETCARYSDVFAERGAEPAPLTFFRMAYPRDFAGLTSSLAAWRQRD